MAARTRTMTNTVQGAVEMAQSLKKKLDSPIALTPEEAIIFDDVVSHREASTWDRHDLRIAAQLARASEHINNLDRQIKAEGYTIVNERGTTVENPKVRTLNAMSGVQLQLNKTLGLHASATGLTGSDQGKRNTASRKAKEVLTKAADPEELI